MGLDGCKAIGSSATVRIVNGLFLGWLSLFLATNAPGATGATSSIEQFLPRALAQVNDPVEREYRRLLEGDDAAQAEADEWIQQARKSGDDLSAATLRARIQQRFEPVRRAYIDFFARHPDHARARLAYGSFLHDIREDEEAGVEWEKALQLDPKNPAAWNNLANLYGHSGRVTNSFLYYAKAIELSPNEPVYYHNFADTVFLFRSDATNYFHLTEQQVFAKAIRLYNEAQRLDPENFLLASDIAQTYYGIKPPKFGDAALDRQAFLKLSNEALGAWQVALKLARDEIEREGVRIHFARWEINSGRFNEARVSLSAATNQMFDTTRLRLLKKLENEEKKAMQGALTNSPAIAPPKP